MSKWKTEPAGVAEVIGKVETEAQRLEQVTTDFDTVKGQASSIEVQGRSVMSSAFEQFCGERDKVPGKLMYMLQQRCMQIATATMELAGGQQEMSELSQELQNVSDQTWTQHEPAVCRAGDANPYAPQPANNSGGLLFNPNNPGGLPANSPMAPYWAPPGDANNAVSHPAGTSPYASPLLAPPPSGNPSLVGPPAPGQPYSQPFVYGPSVPSPNSDLLSPTQK